MQRIEGVEELLLRLLLALQELDVVDEQDVDVVAVAALERRGAVVTDRVDEVVRELLGADVSHPQLRVVVVHVVTDRVQQVGLAEPRVAVDEQGVVGLARLLGDGDGGGVREPVALTDDERVERVLGVEARGLGVARSGSGIALIARRTRRQDDARVGLRRPGCALAGYGEPERSITGFGCCRGVLVGRVTLVVEVAHRCLETLVHADGDAHLLAELIRQRLRHRFAQRPLEHSLRLVEGHGQQHVVTEQPDEARQVEVGAITRADAVLVHVLQRGVPGALVVDGFVGGHVAPPGAAGVAAGRSLVLEAVMATRRAWRLPIVGPISTELSTACARCVVGLVGRCGAR